MSVLAFALISLLLAQSSPDVRAFTFTPKDADPAASDRNLPQLARHAGSHAAISHGLHDAVATAR